MELKSLAYTSRACDGINSADVERILAQARVNNPLDGITGFLIFNGVGFAQVLEGAEDAVDEMYDRLQADSRHTDLTVRDQRRVAARAFPDWGMGYLDLSNGGFNGERHLQQALTRRAPEPVQDLLREMVRTIDLSSSDRL